MIRPNPVWRTAAILGVAGLLLTACGGNDETGSGSSSGSPSASASGGGGGGKGDGELVIGTLLPQTGSLAFLGPPEFAGVDLAAKDINDAGGVNGKPVRIVDSDSGDTKTQTASQSVDRLISTKVDAIIGAASSSVTLSVIDKIVGAKIVQVSPANTSDKLSTYDDKGFYFRTAPPDKLQGRVLGDLILADGNQNVAILALQDAYGEGLANNTEKAVTDGGGQIVAKEFYDPASSDFSAAIGKIKAANPDAIALIAFEETKKIIPQMVQQGVGPKNKKIYFVDGNLAGYDKDFPPGTLTGVKGTLPGVVAKDDFKARLKTVDPKLTEFAYSPESYDATILVALAAEAAKDDSGESIKSKMKDVSEGGEKCTTYKDCLALLKDGKDIDYDGVSGPVEFNDNGDPSQAEIGIYQYGANNKYTFVESKKGSI